jgi:hypothetical protein
VGDAAFSDKFVRITVGSSDASSTEVNIASNFVYKVYGMVLLRSLADLKSDHDGIEFYLEDLFFDNNNSHMTVRGIDGAVPAEYFRFDSNEGLYVNPWYTHNLPPDDGENSLWYGLHFVPSGNTITFTGTIALNSCEVDVEGGDLGISNILQEQGASASALLHSDGIALILEANSLDCPAMDYTQAVLNGRPWFWSLEYVSDGTEPAGTDIWI